MVFSSIVFLLYFLPLVFLVYYAFSFSRRLQNIWLLAASLIFYAWGEPIYVLIMLASIFMNWIFGLLLLRFPKEERVRKLILSPPAFSISAFWESLSIWALSWRP